MMNLILSPEENFLLVLSACLFGLYTNPPRLPLLFRTKNTGPYGRRIPYFESYLRSPFGL